MSKKGVKTACSYIEWDTLLFLIEQLRKEKNNRLVLLIGCGIHFGLRASDLLQLRWKDILNKDRFTVREKKTGKERVITINCKLKDLINNVAKEMNAYKNLDTFIFCNHTGTKPISIQYFNRILDQTFKKYNIPVTENGSSHCLRKSFGRRVYSQMGESEHALVLLQEILGHTSLSTTRRYLGIRQEEISGVYLQL